MVIFFERNYMCIIVRIDNDSFLQIGSIWSKQIFAPIEFVNQSILYSIGKTDIFIMKLQTYFFCK